MGEKKKVLLSVGDFALPVPRKGSIDALSGYGRATQMGIEIHQQVQKRRAREYGNYEAEVPIAMEFERGDFLFRVAGRIDGLFRDKEPRIEEIKSTFQVKELAKRLRSGTLEHPYCLQLLSYGYFFYKQEEVLPELAFHLVSTRNFESDTFLLDFDLGEYEEWLEKRLDELEEEAEAAVKRADRRRKEAGRLAFPFAQPRTGQLELIGSVEEGMLERKRMLIQAPTGLGKTVGVLYPSLQNALQRGQRVVYVTPKNSQHAVAEDAVERLQEKGAKIRSLTITAKSKICFKNEPLCNPGYCEYAKDHYTKMAEHKVLEKLAKKKKLTKKTFQDLARTHEVCPFELQLEAAQDAETVVCDYNYVFAPRSAFTRLSASGLDQDGKPNLVIDEAHNLPARAMDYHSPELSSFTLTKMREQLTELHARFRIEALELLEGAIAVLKQCAPPGTNAPRKIDPPAALFHDHDLLLRAFLSRYLESDEEILAGDPVLRLCFYWSEFTAALEFVEGGAREEFFTTFAPHPSGGVVRITCCDASSFLKACYDDYEQVVGFSATLKPFDFYSQLAGLKAETLKTAEFRSPFPKSQRKLLIIPQISSKYADRQRNYPKVAETIARISALRPGNYFAFFPSFEFLEKTLALFQTPPGFCVLRQERYMRADEIEDVLAHLKAADKPTILFAVSGGVFAEGVDYPGEMAIGAFVVGPPLPSFELEREEMRAYYEKHYKAGFDYAYTFPAMAKAVQAAGRVIRSETDRGLIVLMDSRFLQPSYGKSMPEDWFSDSPQELVSGQILKEIEDFWDGRQLSYS
ncbi:MAG TPA: helicase C-terminal domain-containing protein [Bdellovibrionota bacterium]